MTSQECVTIVASTGSRIACSTVLFRHRGVLRVTAIVKATFTLAHGEVVTSTAPHDIVHADRHGPGDASSAASDRVPYRPRVDVTFVGRAHAPRSANGVAAVRLALYREQALLDKTLLVDGERPTALAPKPCASGALDGRAHETDILEIPDGFDWRSFQSAPADQQVDALRGDEWIVLDGLHPELPRLATRLPSAVAVARIQRLTSSEAVDDSALPLVPDTLAIDGERQCCDVVWRGSFALGGDAEPSRLRIVAGLDVPRRAAAAADPSSPANDAVPATAPPSRASANVQNRLAAMSLQVNVPAELRERFARAQQPNEITTPRKAPGTLLDASLRAAPLAPFPLAAPAATRTPAPVIAGAPWSAVPAPAVPKINDALAGTSLLVDAPTQAPPVRAWRDAPIALPVGALASPPASAGARGVPGGTMASVALPAGVAAPFPLAPPTAARSPSPEVAGAPWAVSPAPSVPKVANPLAGTSLLVDARGMPQSPRPGAGAARPPALPLKGRLYGRPRSGP